MCTLGGGEFGALEVQELRSVQSVSCRGYRLFREQVDINLRKINLIFGRNGSGKSTIARLPLFAMSSVRGAVGDAIPLIGNDLTFGQNMVDLVYNYLRVGDFSVGMAICVDDRVLKFSSDVQPFEDADLAPYKITKCSISGAVEFHAEWKIGEAAERRFEVPGVQFSGIWPFIEQHRMHMDPFKEAIIRIRDNSQYFAPLRGSIERRMTVRRPEVGVQARCTPTGGMAADLFREDQGIQASVNQWAERVLGGIEFRCVQSLDDYSIVVRKNGRDVNLLDSGEGLKHFFPILVHLVRRKMYPGDTEWFDVIEQPELHLHDAVHPEIADIIIDSVQTHGQILVETHSEGLLMRLRTRLAEKSLAAADVAIYWCDEHSRVRPIGLSQKGELFDWPSGVFFETFEELKRMRRALRDALPQ